VVCWDAVHFNVVEIEENFKAAGQELTIINSGDMKRDHWDNVGDIRYYRQFRRAVENFDMSYDYMGFICGDVSSDKWGSVLKRANEVLNNYNVGVYAPHLTNEPWNKDSCYLKNVEDDLFLACQTDGIMVFINKDIVKIIKEYFDFFDTQSDLSQFTSGWGMDMIWSMLSMYHNLLVLRDNKYVVNHPAGSSYDHGKATFEMGEILRIFFEYAKFKSYELIKLNNLKANIDGRMSRDQKFMSADIFYNNIQLLKFNKKYFYHIISIDDSRNKNKLDLISKLSGTKIEIPVLNTRIKGEKEKFFNDNPEVKVTWSNLKNGEIGCFGSHYLAWKYLKNSKLESLIIFEDDIIVHDNFEEQYNKLINNAPKGWDIISIFVDPNQHSRFDITQEVNYYISKGYQDWSTLGYIISKSGAEKICNFVEKNGMNQPVDWYIFRNGHVGTFNVYTLPPYVKNPLEIDHSHPSLVQGEINA
jgi:GR25 family glycosyltransferase involved in LPS biosynthesis